MAGEGKLILEDFIAGVVYGFKPPRPAELRVSVLVTSAARANSQDCVDELLNLIYRLASAAFEKQNEKYFRDWMMELYRAYHSSPGGDRIRGFHVAGAITHRLPWVSSMLERRAFRHKESGEHMQRLLPYTICHLNLCLQMLKTSAERHDEETFDAVLEDIQQFLKHEVRGAKNQLHLCQIVRKKEAAAGIVQPNEDTDKERLTRTCADIIDYKMLVYVICAAWLMHSLGDNRPQREKVFPLVDRLLKKIPDVRSLLDLYAMPGMADMGTNHDNPLRFDSWDWPYSPYPQTKCGTTFQRWVEPFYRFLLLKKAADRPPGRTTLDSIRQTEWASHDSPVSFLEKIASEDYMPPAECTNVPWEMKPEAITTGKAQLKKLLESWKPQESTAADEAEPASPSD